MGYMWKRVKSCRTCGREFHPHLGRGETSHWCSRACFYASRRVHSVCARCGREFYSLKWKPRTFCSRACWLGRSGRGTTWRNPLLKGERHVSGHGYVYLHAPDHPSVQGKPYKRVAEHRLVMERVLGRRLHPWENIHHKDGNRQNNDPANLEVWVVNQPAGQASEYLKEIIQLRRRIAELEASHPPPTAEHR